MARMLGDTETAFDSARSQFWVVDAKVSCCINDSVNFQMQGKTQSQYGEQAVEILSFMLVCKNNC